LLQSKERVTVVLLEEVSSLLLKIHRVARDCQSIEDIDHFQSDVFNLLSNKIPCSGGVWLEGSMTTQGAAMSNFCLFQKPIEMMFDYERVKQHDDNARALYRQFLNTPYIRCGHQLNGKTLHPEVRAFLTKWDLWHGLNFLGVDPVINQPFILAIWRGKSDDPFKETESALIGAIGPHLTDVVNATRLRLLTHQFLRASATQPAENICNGFVDATGCLMACSKGLKQALHAGWPAWCGPLLPQQFAEKFMSFVACNYVTVPDQFDVRTDGTVFELCRVADGWMISARAQCAADLLSDRERTVAHLVAQGLSYKEIAQQLSIAPATARNHLAALRQKLGVRKQVEIANLMRAG
jgi:DNA-binding CsgD family transcriptional regulator